MNGAIVIPESFTTMIQPENRNGDGVVNISDFTALIDKLLNKH